MAFQAAKTRSLKNNEALSVESKWSEIGRAVDLPQDLVLLDLQHERSHAKPLRREELNGRGLALLCSLR